jgi:hypothetical protein
MRSSEIPASTRPPESFIAPFEPCYCKTTNAQPQANHRAVSVEGQLESEAAKGVRRA